MVNINADKITIMDAESIVTGEFQNVGGTAYDLRVPSNLGEKMAKLPAIGFDNNYCVTCGTDKSVKFIAEYVILKYGNFSQLNFNFQQSASSKVWSCS